MVERRKRVYENVTAAVREGIITRNEARDRLGLAPIDGGNDIYIAANLFPLGSPVIPPASGDDAKKDAEDAYGEKTEIREDVFTTEDEALERAKEIGCVGSHSHTEDGKVIYMPCNTHSEYNAATNDDGDRSKAESDVDTKPTEAMQTNATRGLKLRKEFNRGGTLVGVSRANQLKSRERLSPRTVRRMHSYFSRHEVDKQGVGFNRGEEGYPSAGLIAWLLWGGDSGQTWARKKAAQLDKERGKYDTDLLSKDNPLSSKD
jgi:hypothetical protein